MTDRLRGFTVLLDRDIRVDDFEDIKRALYMIKYVKQVDEVINDGSEYIAEMKITQELREKMYEFIKD